MADCSAAGTTIDQAAAAIISQARAGGGNSSSITAAAKHVGTLFGHAAAAAATTNSSTTSAVGGGNGGVVVLPVATPQSMFVLSSSSSVKNTTSHGYRPRHPTERQQQVVSDNYGQHHQVQHQIASQEAAMHYHHQQQQQHHQQFLMMHQQQQAMAMMMMQQQQQQQMMIASQQQELKHRQKMKQDSKAQSDLRHDRTLDDGSDQQTSLGHHGIVKGAGIEDLAAAWAQAEADYEDEYGNLTEADNYIDQAVGGATMEQLAAAWAQVEAEYDAEYTEHRGFQQINEDVDDLWKGQENESDINASLGAHPASQYEFINAVQKDAVDSSKTSSTNFMEQGLEAFRQGRLKESIRCFELELQTQNRNNATAWKMLGKAHAESDQDQRAILCLEEAVKIDPYSPDSLLSLAVSYLNELNHERALSCMKEFLTHNPKYVGVDEIVASFDQSKATDDTRNRTRQAFNEVKSMLLAALEYDPKDAADIHEALGVLYNVSKEYELAAESFREALKARQDSDIYQLWNKLGATQANSGKSDEALSAYTQALRIKPKYARAWLNMGISYSNLGDFDEASRCYLQTLALNPDATHCWTYLRMSLSSNERWDLLPFVFSHDIESFQDHFDFVL